MVTKSTQLSQASSHIGGLLAIHPPDTAVSRRECYCCCWR